MASKLTDKTALYIGDRDAFDALVSEVEGRLESMADDGLEESNDYDDLAGVLQWLITMPEPHGDEWPLVLGMAAHHVDFAMGVQLEITVENLLDWAPETDLGFEEVE